MTNFPIKLPPKWQKIWNNSRHGKGMLPLTWRSIEPFVRKVDRATDTSQGVAKSHASKIMRNLVRYYRLRDKPLFVRRIIKIIYPPVVSYSLYACIANDINLLKYWLSKNELSVHYIRRCYAHAIDNKNLDMVKVLSGYSRRLSPSQQDIMIDQYMTDVYIRAIRSRYLPIIKYMCSPNFPFPMLMTGLIETYNNFELLGQLPANTRVSDTIRLMVLRKYVHDYGEDTSENINQAHQNNRINVHTATHMNQFAQNIFRYDSPVRKIQSAWRKRENVKTHRRKTTMKRLRGNIFAR